MTIKRITTTLWAAALVVGLAGCEELTDLDVVNENAPDAERALSNPTDVEALIGGAFATWWSALNSWSVDGDGGWPLMTSAMADESSMSWTNFGLRHLSSEPRIAWPNSSTYGSSESVSYPYSLLYGALSAERDGIVAINDGLEIETAARTQRALAIGKFVQGLSHGYLAMFWDQAQILNEDTDLSADIPFVTYTEVMTEAIANLNASIAISDANTFTTEPGWFNGPTLTNDELSELAHSFIARYLANVARTAADRAAVDWNLVKTHIAAGVTSEFAPLADEKFGNPDGPWFDLLKWAQGGHSWSRADYRTIGGVVPNDPETDPDGTYAAWLNTPVDDRVQYGVNTQDKRIQKFAGVDACVDPAEETLGGGCGALDPGAVDPGTDFRYAAGSPFLVSRGTYHFSAYKPTRYDYHTPDSEGPMPHVNVTEMQLLLAEAHLHLSEAGAAAIINNTRVTRGGLSAATDGDADIWEKLYYEKLIENYNLAAGLAFTERRGAREIAVSSSVPGLTLVGLVPRTPRHFPVPGAELDVLQLPLYTFGGDGPDKAPAAAGARWTGPAMAAYKFNPEWTAAEKLQHLTDMRGRSGLPSYR